MTDKTHVYDTGMTHHNPHNTVQKKPCYHLKGLIYDQKLLQTSTPSVLNGMFVRASELYWWMVLNWTPFDASRREEYIGTKSGCFTVRRDVFSPKRENLKFWKYDFRMGGFMCCTNGDNLHTIRCVSSRGVDWCQNRSIICDNEAYFGRNAKYVLIQFREYLVKFVFRPYRTIYRRYRIDLYTKRCVSSNGVDWYQNQVIWTTISARFVGN